MDIIFDKDNGTKPYKDEIKQKEEEIERLYNQIGKLSTHLEWAKKKSKEAGIEI